MDSSSLQSWKSLLWKYVLLSLQWLMKVEVVLYNFSQGTNFFWMFVEGLYLHIIIVWTYSADKIKLRYLFVIGWSKYNYIPSKPQLFIFIGGVFIIAYVLHKFQNFHYAPRQTVKVFTVVYNIFIFIVVRHYIED